MNPLRLVSALALLACLLLSGCQTWSRGGGEHTSKQGFRLSTPSNWIQHPAINGKFLATRDGFFLQCFTAHRQPLSTLMAHNKGALSATLTPYELAELAIDDLKADHSLHRLTIVENTPAKLGGRDAIRLVFDHYTEDESHFGTARYLCIHGDHLYVLNLQAPARHYFADALPVFDEIARSFAFTEK